MPILERGYCPVDDPTVDKEEEEEDRGSAMSFPILRRVLLSLLVVVGRREEADRMAAEW